jgi:hypothetical protein
METQEALKKIEEINAVIQSSNKALFSGKHMALYGVMLLLIPLIGGITQWLTFGHDFGAYQSAYISLANTFFFWGLAFLIGRVVPRSNYYRQSRATLHPLIQKAFSLSKPIVFSIVGVVIVLSITNQSVIIYPVVFILLGLMFSIFGRFSIPAVSYIAWSYIFCGLLHFYLIQFNIPYLGIYFLVYNGLSYIFMGFLLSKEEKAHGE